MKTVSVFGHELPVVEVGSQFDGLMKEIHRFREGVTVQTAGGEVTLKAYCSPQNTNFIGVTELEGIGNFKATNAAEASLVNARRSALRSDFKALIGRCEAILKSGQIPVSGDYILGYKESNRGGVNLTVAPITSTVTAGASESVAAF